MKKYFIGADVSKKTLDCVLYDDNSLKMKGSHIKITNDREGRDGLVKWMKGLGVTVNDAIVCMEYTGIYSYSFAELLAKKKIDFTMIPPLKIKGAFAGARGKNDKVDAMRIATYANRYKDEIKPMDMKDDKIVALRNLMNDRKMAVKCAAAYNHIKEYMKEKHINRAQLAEQFGVTKGYITQVLNGDFNHRLSKFVELSLKIGYVPKITFEPVESIVEEECKCQNTASVLSL